MGAAVVCTSNAAEGLVMRHGIDLYIEDDEQKFAKRVIDLINDPEKRTKLLKSAQQQLIDHYDWQNNLKKMESIMKDIVSGEKKNAEGGI